MALTIAGRTISYLTPGVLDLLLRDKSTGKNILWATDSYEPRGEGYAPGDEILPELVSGLNGDVLRPRARKGAADQLQRTRKRAEVFTPAWLCGKMNDYLDEVWFGRPDVFFTWEGRNWTPTEGPVSFPEGKGWQAYVDSRRLEITCGEAPFLATPYDSATGEAIPLDRRVGLLDRKLRVVNENTADEAESLKWTIRAVQSVYGYEYQGDSLLLARLNLLSSFIEYYQASWGKSPSLPVLRKIANILSWNLFQLDGTEALSPTGSLAEKAYQQLTLFDEKDCPVNPIRGSPPSLQIWTCHRHVRYPELRTLEGRRMKFDFAIGNPPYQDETVGEQKTYAPPVYHLFLDAAYGVADRVEMIHPARFLFNAGSTPKQWNQRMLTDPHLKVLWYEQKSGDVFSETDIKGGVAVTYRDVTQNFGAIKVFTSFPELNSIMRKVSAQIENNLSSIIYIQVRFNLDVLYKDHPDFKGAIGSNGKDSRFEKNIFKKIPIFSDDPSKDAIKVLGIQDNKRVWKYVSKKYVDTSHENLLKYKVLLPTSNGSGAIGEVLSTPLIGEPLIGEPLIGYTRSFIGIGSFDTYGEAAAALKYVKSKFCRTMLGVLKITQDNNKETWRYVPLQDFTPASDIDWSASIPDIDRQLYAKYHLSEGEIAFIESKVKEME